MGNKLNDTGRGSLWGFGWKLSLFPFRNRKLLKIWSHYDRESKGSCAKPQQESSHEGEGVFSVAVAGDTDGGEEPS